MAAGSSTAAESLRGGDRGRHAPLALIGAVLVVGALIAGAFGLRWIRTADSIASVTCVETAPFTAITQPGRPWDQTRHSLLATGGHMPRWSTDRDGRTRPDHVVLNERTGRAFRWHYRLNADGSIEYFLPTRYVLLANRGWEDEPWALCRLAPATDTMGRTE